MTAPESERLVRVEERQREMTDHIAELAASLKENSKLTSAIKETLDELTGAKKFLMWVTGMMAAVGTIVVTWLGVRHK